MRTALRRSAIAGAIVGTMVFGVAGPAAAQGNAGTQGNPTQTNCAEVPTPTVCLSGHGVSGVSPTVSAGTGGQAAPTSPATRDGELAAGAAGIALLAAGGVGLRRRTLTQR